MKLVIQRPVWASGVRCGVLVALLVGTLFVTGARATNHITRIESVLAGFDGDPTIQFVQMVANGNSQKRWGPQGGEVAGRAMLLFFDAAGTQTGQFVFTNDPPPGANTVLIATAEFAALPGAPTPDIIIPSGLMQPGSGKVCFKNNPANTVFVINLCLSYGSFTGSTEGAGPPAAALPATGLARSLNRFQNNGSFGAATNNNADFMLGSPSPVNTSGNTFIFPGEMIDVSPAAIDFDTQPVSFGASLGKKFFITNTDLVDPLTIASVALTQGPEPDQFVISNDTGEAVVSPGATRVVTLVFDPGSPGPKTARFDVFSDSGNRQVTLSGLGINADRCLVNDPAGAVALDNCADAHIVCPSIIYNGSTAGASNDGSSTCGNSETSADVWYRYAPAVDGVLTISLSGSTFDTVLSVHSGCLGTIANELACDDDGGGGGTSQITSMPVFEGVEVFLRIAGFSGATGNFQMLLTGPACFDYDRDGNGVADECEIDFGDAPTSYGTLKVNDGGRHRTGAGLHLGERVDTEGDGQPNVAANGDDFDGPASDDDGVVFVTALRPGVMSTVEVTASTGGGFLNGWIDYNDDGDWDEIDEKVFTAGSLVAGVNVLNYTVPITAAPTDRTYARFRIGSDPSTMLTPLGEADDGEVEDYAVEISPVAPVPGGLGVRISEVMVGLNGDSSIQFVELEVAGPSDKAWGAQGPETAGRAMLEFVGPDGSTTGRFVFPVDAPAGGSSVLVATQAFVDSTGLAADFIMPAEVVPIAGQVAFRDNPDNSHFSVDVALSYGGSGFTGLTHGAGAPNPEALPIMGASALTPIAGSVFGTNDNSDFSLMPPTPTNSVGATVVLAVDTIENQGETLFLQETFRGNGRTCATCHLPGSDQFGLSPATIAALPPDDPLFIAEFNLNTLVLSAPSQPSDLRGAITGTTGSATVISGSGDTYLVYGGDTLSGTILDGGGSGGVFAVLNPGDLGTGPTNSNGSPRGLEDPAKMRGGRSLILENIDGFGRLEVFRSSPHLLNVAETAPYGLSGEFPDLQGFSRGAVGQHFPRSLARVSGIDFREPSGAELAAMEAFQNTIRNPADADFSLDRFATTQAQKRGRDLFFGDEAKCSKCHSGPTLADSDGTLPGSIAGINENFDTGIANRHENLPAHDDLPTEPAGLIPGQSTRLFNTPPLFGVKLTAPFFHDASSLDLQDAVEFYDTAEFIGSPAGLIIEDMDVFGDPQNVLDIVAFLESLVEIPVDFTRQLDFGTFCESDPLPPDQLIAITNSGTVAMMISAAGLAGPSAGEFLVISDTGEVVLNPGETREVMVGFVPLISGSKDATFEVIADVGGDLGVISFGCDLIGNILPELPPAVSLPVFNFADRDVEATPLTSPLINFTNLNPGSIGIASVEIVGPDAAEFFIFTDTGESVLGSGALRRIRVRFDPSTSGLKEATLRLNPLTCSGAPVDVAITGTGTVSLDHFIIDPIPSPQIELTPFPVTVRAIAANGEAVESFVGISNLFGVDTSGGGTGGPILITEIDTAPDQVEFMNVSTTPVDVTGWTIVAYDQSGFPNPRATIVIPPSPPVAPSGFFRLNELGTSPGIFPEFFTGINLGWVTATTEVGVLLLDELGAIVDFATTTADASVFTTPVTIPPDQWTGPGIPVLISGARTYQRVGGSDTNTNADWEEGVENVLLANPGLIVPLGVPIAMDPLVTPSFVAGVAVFDTMILGTSTEVRLGTNDGAGHAAQSNAFEVVEAFGLWLALHFTEAELVNPAISGLMADFDLDGLNTLAEYALGKDPKVYDNFGLLEVGTTTVGLDEHIQLIFKRRINDPLLSVEPEAALDLAIFGPVVGPTVSSVPAEPGFETATYIMPNPIGALLREYFRLLISRSAGP